MKKLLVTGAHGFVAGSVLTQARAAGWEVHALSRGEPLLPPAAATWHRLDPLDPAALAGLFATTPPQAVIHAAAAADIDVCQKQPELARAVNVEFTRTLATLCARHATRLVFCSTDTVFDGEHAPYDEAAEPLPVNFYGETKVEAERIVATSGASAVVARLALVMGYPVLGAGNSFFSRLQASLRAGRQVAVPAHEVRTPVDVLTLGAALVELAGNSLDGIVHLAGNEALNRLELTQRIGVRMGFPATLVVTAEAAPTGRAPRPRDVSLDNRKARQLLRTPMLDFEAALARLIPNPPAPHP